ncbi:MULTISPECIES: alpha/beta hydrolase [unclassified Streptomyces]|uniref:alpha/beta fold hydrolase n=1 Tax=unclassified Streptomyces TaxID=2593676 RepID=UPI000700EFC2|nr:MULTISPECIES: alpha/beta hydrolase [unclassified Streptomyces]KQX49961.1 hydrolase [Streptomyces sp. Root1304]KRA79996.1 hydrolase [Streptomyces sp. Root66D1]
MPHFTTYDGTELAYRITGEGEPLVCLAGGPLRDADYLGDLGGLSAHRALVLLDARGTGASAEPADPGTYRCDRQVDDVEALRAHLGLERLDLLGHSAGGNLATLYAAAYPERIRSLVLVTSLGRALGVGTTDEEWDAAVEVFADRPWYPEARAALDGIGPDTPAPRVREIVAPFGYGRWDAAAREHASAENGQSHWAAAAAYHGEGAYDPERTRRALTALTAPVLILAGEYDAGPTPAKAAEAAACFPGAELVVQPGAGHFPWVDDADAFVRPVAAFLDPEVRTVTVDGVRLAHRVRGSEDAPPVVLVHGRGENSTTWAEIARELAADHRVYALDLRGHGLSDRPGRYGFDAFRDELGGFLRALGLTGATVVAHSMGAAAAYLLAQREPELIGRLVLEEPPVFFPLDPPRPRVARPEGRLGFDWEIVPATDAQLNAPDPAWRAEVPMIKAPTLVLAGGPASHVPQEHLTWLAEHVADGRLVTIEDAGHLVHTTRRDAFLRSVREFGLSG